MKLSCIFKQAVCLISLFFLTCHSKVAPKRICSPALVTLEHMNLLNKTAEFKKLFPDDITNMKLLTSALKEDFKVNCSTRLHLLSFYTDDVLSADMVLPKAQKSGIREAFMKIDDMIRRCQTLYSKCPSSKPTEETEEIKDFRRKINKITLKEKLHKAISEIDDLLILMNSFMTRLKSNKTSRATLFK